MLLALFLPVPAAFGGDGDAPSAAAEVEPAPTDQPEDAPGFGLHRYQRILLSPLRVAYSSDPDRGNRHDPRREIAPEDLARFQRYYREALEKGMEESHPIATEPSADVLRIDTVLIDPVVDKSAWNAPARNVYSELQTIRLVVVLRDSRTDRLLQRVRLPVRMGTSRFSEQNAVTYWAQVRLVFAQLATRVQWALEDAEPPASS
jgi:hypothetical protein